MSENLHGNSMKKTKPIASATAFIRKRKEKWRPSLNGSEDMSQDGSSTDVSQNNCYICSS